MNTSIRKENPIRLSIIIPCFNEEKTLRACVEKVREISDDSLSLEIIIVDDRSTDQSLSIALELEKEHPEVTVLRHEKNRGKGAALRTGFKRATGDFVAVQDADLEYNPMELKNLLVPLVKGDAEVVLGSRFLSFGPHRVLYFWHYLGNRFLTLLSNMFTDLNLTDMETCYKVFRRDVIQSIDIQEDRFGFEPEIVAKVADMRLRIYEAGISYHGRTYEEGKKIGVKDGFRALYCILRYNAHRAPIVAQFLLYLFIGGAAALVNFSMFLSLYYAGCAMRLSALLAFASAACVNYFLCVWLLFRHKARWSSAGEVLIYFLLTGMIGLMDLETTVFFHDLGASPPASKLLAIALGLVLNYLGRRYLVFPEPPRGPWKPQLSPERHRQD